MPTNIRDVARRLNLSITTVSRALDGYGDVAEETRKLVVRTAQEMGYVPNRAARELRRKRTETIGYILPASAPQFSDPFFSEFIAGLGDEAAAKKYDLLVSTAPPDTEAERMIYQRWVQGRKVDGFILNRVRLDDWRMDYLSERNLPLVSLERSRKQNHFIGIEVDSRNGMCTLISHLVQTGHERIGYIGTGNHYVIQADRFAGYQDGLEQSHIPYRPEYCMTSDLTSSGGYLAAQKLLSLDPPPTAIACINDLTAMGVLHAAHDRGLDVGHDLAVAGFDGIADSAHTQPPLTTLNQPVYEIARQLVDMLLSLASGIPLIQTQITIQPEIIIRRSTTG